MSSGQTGRSNLYMIYLYSSLVLQEVFGHLEELLLRYTAITRIVDLLKEGGSLARAKS